MHEITFLQKKQIKQLQKDRVSQRKIAKILGINRTTVQYHQSKSFRKRYLERQKNYRENLSSQKKRELQVKQTAYVKKRYHEDETYRRKCIENVRKRQIEKNAPVWRLCPLCRGRINLRKEEFEYQKISKHTIKEIRGEYYDPQEKDPKNYCFYHTACFKKVEVPLQRKLLDIDFTHRLLGEFWVELDEYGKAKWNTLFSNEEEVDKKLQALKKKGLSNLSPKEKEWLRGMMN